MLVLLSTSCGTAPLPDYPEKTELLVWKDAEGVDHPVRSPDDWRRRRAHILRHMEAVMGPLPDASKKVPLDPQVVEEVRLPDGLLRRKVLLAVEEGDRLPAYLFLPKDVAGRAPAVLCLHPTSREHGKGVVAGLAGKPDRHYAQELAGRGYVTLAPDYVGMGEYKVDAYARGYASATMKGIWNHQRCLDYLQSLPEVDPARLGAIGHSLGGHNAMFLAAFDERVACVVSNCGFCSFPRYMKGDLSGWSHAGYMPRIRTSYGLSPARMPFDFTEVAAALAPRAFLASAPLEDSNFDVQGVRDCIAAAAPVYAFLGAREKLAAQYPACGHDFPDVPRRAAFDWLDRWLKS